MKRLKIDLSDVVILSGFSLLTWGIHEAFGRPCALMTSGFMLLGFGLLMAKGSGK